MQLNHNTGVIAIVIDSNDMNNPRVKTMPAMLQALINAARINARVVIPEAVHTNEDATVAMSRNIDHISEGPQLGEQPQPGEQQQPAFCEKCGNGPCLGGMPTPMSPMSLLDAFDNEVSSASLTISVCLSDTRHKIAGRSIESRYSHEGVIQWSEHPIFAKNAWAGAVSSGETELGYWQWVNDRVEAVLTEAAKEGLLES